MQEKVLGPNRITRHYTSLVEMVQHAEQAEHLWPERSSRTERASPAWDAGVGYAGALKLASEGWPEGIKQISAMAHLVSTGSVATRGYEVAGEYPDIGRALSGDPKNMVRRGSKRAPKPVVTIAVGLSMSGAVNSRLPMNYGAALAGLIDRLESYGVRIELHAAGAVQGHGNFGEQAQVSVAVCLKRPEDAMDHSAIAFAIAHPAMFRRLMLSAFEKTTVNHYPGPSYGKPVTRFTEEHYCDLPEGATILNGVQAAAQESETFQGAVKFLQLQLNVQALANIAELEVL